jgi:uncharacterized pyridoxamine 5'-phosphate oxidase family protein
MNEVVKFLNENPTQYLGTIDKDGNPKVRPFQFMLEKGGKLFFCTSNMKDVYEEIKNKPNIELCTSSSNLSWIRLSGKVVFSNDIDVKNAIIEQSSLVRSIYKTPDNPIFEIFYIENAKAIISDFSGQPPKTINL